MNLNCAGGPNSVADIVTTFRMVGVNESRRTVWRLQSIVIESSGKRMPPTTVLNSCPCLTKRKGERGEKKHNFHLISIREAETFAIREAETLSLFPL